MKASIKIVKRRRDERHNLGEDSNESKPETQMSVERSTSEIVSTVKSWIVELQERKRAQDRSFPPFNVATASQNS